jgi:dGTPase
VAGALGLNTDLAEALALVHDIGHPPFGHAGERKLDKLLRPHGGRFNHNLQALRIVEEFEQRYLDFAGLNLTFEVREGIIKHSRDYDAAQFPELSEYLLDERPPLESQLIDFVDEIAYNSADLDDGFESKLLDIEIIRTSVPLFAEFYKDVERTHPQGRDKLKFNVALKRMLDHLVTDLIENTRAQAAASGARSVDDIRYFPKRIAGFSPDVSAANAALKRFLLTRLYNHPSIVIDRERSVDALAQLFAYYLEHPEAMPKSYTEFAQHNPPYRIVCDYIAGMTDHFLLQRYEDLLGTGSARSAN